MRYACEIHTLGYSVLMMLKLFELSQSILEI